MVQKILIGIFAGALIGLFITSIFIVDASFTELFLTKITATSIISGFFCGIYAHFSKSKLQVFLISILIGVFVFYTKYLITGHDFNPVSMGTFVGAMLGGTFSVIRKFTQHFKINKKLNMLRQNGFKY